MERTELTLGFDDVASRVAFAGELETADLSKGPFRVVLSADTQNMDNELLQLLLTFMENNGLVALAAFIGLVRDILKKTFPDKTVVVTYDGKKATISAKTTDSEVKKIADDFKPS